MIQIKNLLKKTTAGIFFLSLLSIGACKKKKENKDHATQNVEKQQLKVALATGTIKKNNIVTLKISAKDSSKIKEGANIKILVEEDTVKDTSFAAYTHEEKLKKNKKGEICSTNINVKDKKLVGGDKINITVTIEQEGKVVAEGEIKGVELKK